MDSKMIDTYESTAKIAKRLSVLEEDTDPLVVNLADMVLELVKELRAREGTVECWGFIFEDGEGETEYMWYSNEPARDRGFDYFVSEHPDTNPKKLNRVYV